MTVVRESISRRKKLHREDRSSKSVPRALPPHLLSEDDNGNISSRSVATDRKGRARSVSRKMGPPPPLAVGPEPIPPTINGNLGNGEIKNQNRSAESNDSNTTFNVDAIDPLQTEMPSPVVLVPQVSAPKPQMPAPKTQNLTSNNHRRKAPVVPKAVNDNEQDSSTKGLGILRQNSATAGSTSTITGPKNGSCKPNANKIAKHAAGQPESSDPKKTEAASSLSVSKTVNTSGPRKPPGLAAVKANGPVGQHAPKYQDSSSEVSVSSDSDDNISRGKH